MCLQSRFKMRARFVSSVSCIYPKNPSTIFTSQNSSQILREYICNPLSNRGRIEKYVLISIKIFNIIFYPHNFETFQQNLIISKSATIFHCSSTMAYGIG